MSKSNRRTFMKQAALAGAGFWAAGGLLAADKETKAPNEQLQIACIGVGGKGSSDTDQAANHGRIVRTYLTDAGRQVVRDCMVPALQAEDDFLSVLTAEERETLVDLLGRLAKQ